MKCARCGYEVKKPRDGQTLCSACERLFKARRSQANYSLDAGTTMICERCKRECRRYSPKQKYCDACSPQIQRERAHERDRRKREQRRNSA